MKGTCEIALSSNDRCRGVGNLIKPGYRSLPGRLPASLFHSLRKFSSPYPHSRENPGG